MLLRRVLGYIGGRRYVLVERKVERVEVKLDAVTELHGQEERVLDLVADVGRGEVVN